MKKFYLVRHGESEVNTSTIYHTLDSSLTTTGIQQAHYLAERCALLPIELIISSTMQRAQETAAIITEKIHKPVEFSPLFVERRRPSLFLGKKQTLKYWKCKKESMITFMEMACLLPMKKTLITLKNEGLPHSLF